MSAPAIALNRFGLGARPEDEAPAQPQRWLLDQLSRYEPLPAPWAALPRTADVTRGYSEYLRTVRATAQPQPVQQRYRRDARDDYLLAVAARSGAALRTSAPFAERLVHFWSNHFAVSVDKLAVINLAGPFEADAIRPNVLGKFEDLLLAVVRHPAMLLYLDQASSIGPDSAAALRTAQRDPLRSRGLNENLAREILELHTLGVRTGYTQADVTEFARALTGWSIIGAPAGRDAAVPAAASGYEFRPLLHEPGVRTVLGRAYSQAGEAQARAILHDLATASATARHLATKLARHFIADTPPPALVDRLAEVFLRTDGDLPTVYRVLVESRESWQETAMRFKSPWDWSVSALRALGRDEVAGMQMTGLLSQLGQTPWRPGSPAGFDDVEAAWAAPDALLRRVEAAQRIAALAGGTVDARALAPRLLPGVLGGSTAEALGRAESAQVALALLLVSPEFLRR